VKRRRRVKRHQAVKVEDIFYDIEDAAKRLRGIVMLLRTASTARSVSSTYAGPHVKAALKSAEKSLRHLNSVVKWYF